MKYFPLPSRRALKIRSALAEPDLGQRFAGFLPWAFVGLSVFPEDGRPRGSAPVLQGSFSGYCFAPGAGSHPLDR